MASPETFNFTDGDSGYVQKTIGYTVGYGYANCNIALNPLTQLNKKMVERFDTSALGTAGVSNSDITMVEWYKVDSATQPTPNSQSSNFYIGAWCGATLDASANDWNAATADDLTLDVLAYNNNTWINLADGQTGNPTADVNVSGVTDVLIKDTTVSVNPSGHNFNTSKAKDQLRVTYTVSNPRLRMLMGMGLCLLGWLGIKWNPFLKTKVFNPI